MKFDYYEYVKETSNKIGFERGFVEGFKEGFKESFEQSFEQSFERGVANTRRSIVTNMLLQGKSEKDIQATLGLTASQVRELIREVQSNAQA